MYHTSQLYIVGQYRFIASAYGEGTYDSGEYNAVLQAETGSDGELANTGYDTWLYVGVGLILIAVSLFVLLYRRRHGKNRPTKA